MVDYMARQALQGVPWSRIARHMLGLWNGTPGARRWRQVWSDHHHKALAPQAVAALARTARLRDTDRIRAPAEA
jgi:tRNA-dihydrouridine synthase A